ncbi:MAG: hypothetical protein GX939_02895 [Clostridiaceae bacterium]|jgi:alkylation response protein AidB-like acyl-CoA dehydrogenase|nr:hypothetical protein [Clostridiaceae bacterium]
MWYMNEERELLRKMVQNFTEKEVKPFVKEMEEHKTFPREIVRKAGEVGIIGLTYPESYGGSGEDYINAALAIEEIAKESNTAAVCVLLQMHLCVRWLHDYGTPEQKDKILRKIIAGDAIWAGALCEPVGGGNWFAYNTKAVLDNDEWVINGSKIFCTNAGQADYYAVLCITCEPNPVEGRGTTLIMVPKDAPGFKVGHIERKMGWHGSATGQIYFNNCRVPKVNALGPIDMGYYACTSSSSNGTILFGAACLGSAEGVYERTVKYCKEREHVGKSLFDSYQVVRNKLAEMLVEIEAYRVFIYGICETLNMGMDATPQLVAAKIKGARLFQSIASDAMELHGSNGTIVECDIERFLRDAMMNFFGGGIPSVLVDNLTYFI